MKPWMAPISHSGGSASSSLGIEECGDFKRGSCFRANCKFLHGGKPASEVQQASVPGLNGAAGLPTPRAAGAFVAPEGLDTTLYDANTGASGLGTSSGFGLFGTPAWGFRYGSNMPLPKVENVRPLCMDFYKQGFCNRRGPHNQGCLFRHDEIEGKGKIEQPAKAIPPEVMLFGMEAQGVLHKAGTNTLSEVTKAAKQWAESRKTEIEAEEKVAADMQAAMEQASAGAGQDATQTPVGARAPLPAGWKEAKAPDGRVYYYNSVTKATMWTRPTGELGKAPPPLPPGWKEAHAPDGRTYFYHAETKATSWKRPEAPQLDDADKEPGAEEAELDTAATEAGAESARMLESNDNSAPLEGDAPPMAESAHDVPQSPDGAVEAPQANQEAIANEVSLDDKGDEPEAKRARAK